MYIANNIRCIVGDVDVLTHKCTNNAFHCLRYY